MALAYGPFSFSPIATRDPAVVPRHDGTTICWVTGGSGGVVIYFFVVVVVSVGQQQQQFAETGRRTAMLVALGRRMATAARTAYGNDS